MDLEIIRVPKHLITEAVDVLSTAFCADQRFVEAFLLNDTDCRNRLRSLFSWSCRIQSSYHMPLLAAMLDNQIVGVATIHDPNPVAPWLPTRIWLRMLKLIVIWRVGVRSWDRMARYSRAVAKLRPAPPFHLVTSVAVLPSAKGLGIRKALLAAAFELSRESNVSKGLVLDTINPRLAQRLESEGWLSKNAFSRSSLEVFSLFRASET